MDESPSDLTEKEMAFFGSMIIGQGRIYDVLLMILGEMNSQAAIDLRKRHEQGYMYFPPPSVRVDESPQDDA